LQWATLPGLCTSLVINPKAPLGDMTNMGSQVREPAAHSKRSHRKASTCVPDLTSHPDKALRTVNSLCTAIKELTDEIDNPDSILNRTGASKKKELIRQGKNCGVATNN